MALNLEQIKLLLQNQNDEVYKEPSNLILDTMVFICNINDNSETIVKCNYKTIALLIHTIDRSTITQDGILTVKLKPSLYRDDFDNHLNVFNGIIKSFRNQVTLRVNVNGIIINVKVFCTGKLQISGCMSEEAAKSAAVIVIQKIKELQEFMLKYQNVLQELIDTKPKVYSDLLPDEFRIKQIKKTIKLRRLYINSIDKNDKNGINENVEKIILKDILEIEDITERKIDYEFLVYNKEIDTIKTDDYKIGLVNAHFSTNFDINREELQKILKTKYKLKTSFDPLKYQGVNVKFSIDEKNKGVCKCVGKCKCISILIFRTGKIIITGSKDLTLTIKAYEFINEVFKDNFENILDKKSAYDLLIEN